MAVAALLVGLSTPARAQQVDPRWRYVPELAAGFVLISDLSNAANPALRSGGGSTWALRPGFFAPVGENRLAGGGLMVNGGVQVALFGEYRWQQDFADPRVTTRLGAGAMMLAWPDFGLGGRVSAGGGYEFVPGWRAGIDAALSVTVIHFLFGVELLGTISYLF